MSKLSYSKKILIILFISFVSVLFIAACSKKECVVADDCASQSAFFNDCVQNKCVYSPIPGVCGNGVCEPDAGENKCTCPQDCGPCSGAVAGSNYLSYVCIQDECLQDVDPKNVNPVFDSKDLSSGGDRFKVEIFYNNPFNLKRDIFKVKVSLAFQNEKTKEQRITSMNLEGTTVDRRSVSLGSKQLNKVLWAQNWFVEEELILDLPAGVIEGEIRNFVLTVNYEYLLEQSPAQFIRRTGVLKSSYPFGFVFVNPEISYPCPVICDDFNPGTKSYCGPETNFFCVHEPIPGVCGNFICESDVDENKCTCPQDCGPCSGSAGKFLNFECINDECVTVLKDGIVVSPNTIFDERKIIGITLNNNYKFKDPFNVKTDKFVVDFNLYSLPAEISNFKIETIRLLDSESQITESTVNKVLSRGVPLSVQVSVPGLSLPEQELSAIVKIWYSYDRDGKTTQGSFSRPLGKITFINPE